MTDNSKYFDEDGNLKYSKWTLEEMEREEREKQEEKEKEKKNQLKEVNRRLSIDERKSTFEKQHQKEIEARRIRDEWMSMPSWIKKMPRTPLSAPPTEGTKEKAWYKVSGKVTLTDNERKSRENNLRRLSMTMEDYKNIHKPFPHGKKMSFTAIVPLTDKIGSSVITRSVSKAMSESRSDFGISISVDLGSIGNNLRYWYKGNSRSVSTMKNVLNQIRDNQIFQLSATDVFPLGDEGEYYLINREEPERRIDPDADDIFMLFDFISRSGGTTFFDCDPKDTDSLMTTMSMADSVIFLLPSSEHAAALLADMMDRIKEFFGADGIFDADEELRSIISKAMVVMSGDKPHMSTRENVRILNTAVKKSAQVSGISEDRSFFIPYDREMSKPPLDWRRVSFNTKHVLRKICGEVVKDMM